MQLKKSLKSLIVSRKWSITSVVFLLLLLIVPLSLYTMYLFPLFPDEIAIRSYSSRLPYDYPNRATSMGVCYSNFYQAIPIAHLLPGAINWLIHGLAESPTTLRLIGLTIFLTWFIALAFYITKRKSDATEGNTNYRLLPTAFIASMLFVGVFPFFLVLNRNEQLIFPSVLILIAVFMASLESERYSNSKLKNRLALAFLFLVSTSLIPYAHGKGLFFLPFFLIVGWTLAKLFKRKLLAFSLITVFVIFNWVQDYLTWKSLYKCSDFIDFEIFLKGFSIDPSLLFRDPIEFLKKIYESLRRTAEYFQHISFQTEYQWNYLKPQEKSLFISILNFLFRLNITLAALGLVIGLAFYYVKDLKQKKALSINLLLIFLFLIIIISALFNLTKNFYDADYLYTLLVITLVIFIAENRIFYIKPRITIYVVTYLSLISIASQYIFTTHNLTAFENGFTGPGIAMNQYQRSQPAIKAAAKQCNIDPINSNFVITDDLTYGYFRKSHGPIAYTYIFIDSRPDTFKRVLENLDSSGVILSCSVMREDLRAKSLEVDGICCVSKLQLKDIYNLK